MFGDFYYKNMTVVGFLENESRLVDVLDEFRMKTVYFVDISQPLNFITQCQLW